MLDALRDLLLQSEPLLLFLVIALGFLAGEIRVFGVSLGVSAVLFAGLAFGAWQSGDEAPLRISPALMQVGLILFVYAVGLTSGAGFFASFRRRGLEVSLSVLLALAAGAAAALALGRLLALTPGQTAGMFCGALTNTPALASVTELAKAQGIGAPGDAAVGYSLAYPFGVIGALLGLHLPVWLRRARFEEERSRERAAAKGAHQLVSGNFEVVNPALFGRAIGELAVHDAAGVIISRHRHAGEVRIPTKYSVLHEGDVVVAVGTRGDMRRAAAYFGAESREHIEVASDQIVLHRVIMSARRHVGKTLGDLDLARRFNAQVTRLRRADIEFVPGADTALELGDRLRIVMPAEKVEEVCRFFGDSERSVADLDYTALTLGISAGVLLGLLPLPLPGGANFSLGFAGGPLVAGLIFGRLGRTGPLVWSLPFEANQAIRHIGLLFFLAGAGVMAGGTFLEAIGGPGLRVLAAGAAVTGITTVLALFLFLRFAGCGVIAALGAATGVQTQPATLAHAHEMTGSDEVYVTYATAYPIAMVAKILLAQALLLLAR